LAERGDIDAVICIGAVIRGDTDHYEFVARAATEGIARAGDDSGKPVIFGVLTTDNTEDAVARIGHAAGYADAAVEMANTMRQIHELS
jgi:6,7-dimethyl-8-ribityllumazine synthase